MRKGLAWLPYTLLVGKRWIVGAWAVELVALAAIALWVDEPWRAIDLAVGTVILPSLLCWLMPAGALLAHWRASRELRLPREGRGGLAARMALCLGLNMLPAAGFVYAVSQDHDWAVYKAGIVLCILLIELLLLLAPVVLLGFIGFVPILLNQLPWSALSMAWTNPMRIAAALTVAAGEGLLLWHFIRHFLGHATGGTGPGASLLHLMVTSSGTVMDPDRAMRGVPLFMLPRLRVRRDDPVRQRVAHLLGQPYAPGYTRRLLAVSGAIAAGGGLLLAWNLAQGPFPSIGVGAVLASVLPWFAIGAPLAASARLPLLFRAHSAELAELHLLPGQGDRVVRNRRIAGLLLRPLLPQALCAVGAVGVLWGAGVLTAAPVVMAGFVLVAAIAVLEAVRYLDRGQGWLGRSWVGPVLIIATVSSYQVLTAVMGWGAEHARSVALPLPAASALLLAFALWRAWRATQRATERPHALAAQADRAAPPDGSRAAIAVG